MVFHFSFLLSFLQNADFFFSIFITLMLHYALIKLVPHPPLMKHRNLICLLYILRTINNSILEGDRWQISSKTALWTEKPYKLTGCLKSYMISRGRWVRKQNQSTEYLVGKNVKTMWEEDRLQNWKTNICIAVCTSWLDLTSDDVLSFKTLVTKNIRVHESLFSAM